MKIKNVTPWNWFNVEKVEKPLAPATQQHDHFSYGHPLAQLSSEINRLLNDTFRGFPSMLSSQMTWPELPSMTLKPNLDIKAKQNAYEISVEVPGVNKEDVNIIIEGSMLTIHGEKKQETKEDKDNYHCIERHYGQFERVLQLPRDASTENINATFSEGVLTLTIKRDAKPESKGGKKIDIKAAA